MGRHTKLEGEEAPPEQPPRRRRLGFVTAMPLLPVLALVVAIGVVAYAVSTQQISLNFGGGGSPQNLPQADAGDGGRGARDRASRGGTRADGVVVAFRATGRLPAGFRGSVVISNRGSRPVNGWLLGFKIPNAQVLSVTDSVLAKTGAAAWVRNSTAAPIIKPGDRVRLTFVAKGAASRPSVCVFNRIRCDLA